MEKNNSIICLAAIASILSVILCTAIYAWTEPDSNPLGGTIAAPINTGTVSQVKSGFIGIGNGIVNGATYWLGKIGGSFALKNNNGDAKFVVTQDGNVGIGTTEPTEKLEVAGKIKASEVCLSSVCRANWGAAAAQSCPADQAVVGIDNDGILICSGSGLNPIAYPCNTSLPTGNKRIFVTSKSYLGYEVGATATSADSLCQDRANSQSLPGTYKALMYDTIGGVVTRDPYGVLPSPALFWNGKNIGAADCQWNLVASGPNDFFTKDASNNYLANPIRYDEAGNDAGQVYVWTNFTPIGNGTYTGIPTNSNDMCATSGTYNARSIFGGSAQINLGWGFANYQLCSQYPNPKAALYCVEQ